MIDQGDEINEIIGHLENILQDRGVAHGGHQGYVRAMQILINLLLAEKLKRPLTRREINLIMIMHKVARLINADETANVTDTLIDTAGYAVLGVGLEKGGEQ